MSDKAEYYISIGKDYLMDQETFTIAEIRKALNGILDSHWSNTMTTKLSFPDRVIEKLKSYREPDYPVGTVVRDNDDIHWIRTGDKQWRGFWGQQAVDNDIPKRPLRRMVPEK